ncbi:hypothetical protein ACFY9C_21360 [Streptomyces filamentosus]|uniref:hypothetical protein n=1 Tax=Streptomyces filamentosus TaxID=67294 RepID=UPI0036E70B13
MRVKMRKRFAGLLALAAMVTSCASEPAPTPPAESLCVMREGSDGEKAVQRTLRSDRFDTTFYVTTEELVQRLGEYLSRTRGGTVNTCDYAPRPQQGSKGVGVRFSWTPPGEPDWGRVPPEEITRYDVNGVRVESTHWLAKLSVACRLSGELAEASRKAMFQVELSNLLNSERREDAEARKRQIELLYILAGRATDALGCEGDPLEGAPVVKPSPAA